ncbi:MAG: hypothetical protein GY825_04440 [Phycisphaeraceae bacterium]|nr:hypothetical protein [Phycisphaeraceae bacterium]
MPMDAVPPPPTAAEAPATSPAGPDGTVAVAAWCLLVALVVGTLMVHHAPAAPPVLVAASVALPLIWMAAILPLVGFALFDRRWLVGAPALLEDTRAARAWAKDASGVGADSVIAGLGRRGGR